MLADNVQWSEEQIDVAIKEASVPQICHGARRGFCSLCMQRILPARLSTRLFAGEPEPGLPHEAVLIHQRGGALQAGGSVLQRPFSGRTQGGGSC